MLRIEMLHEHKAHARIERQVPEQFRERFQPAGRGAHADNRERPGYAWCFTLLNSRSCRWRTPWTGTTFRHRAADCGLRTTDYGLRTTDRDYAIEIGCGVKAGFRPSPRPGPQPDV